MPAGVPRRVRGPLLELRGEISTGRDTLLLLQNQRKEGEAGSREKRRCLQRFLSFTHLLPRGHEE